ncbi:MAG: exodeoxyribonuclease III [Bacteroidota bacterium]|nr:exodeoxyribonuclease III [Bacteroidota bacterium]
MRLVTYNINGIRAALRKGFSEWVSKLNPDIICLQEIKANVEQFDIDIFTNLGYHVYLCPAAKPGYSGVALLSKIKPTHVEYGCGFNEIDIEGRILRVDFPSFSVMSVYFPSGSSGELRQKFKYKFLDIFQNYINKLKHQIPNIIISGDYNICHTSIDIHNPIRNSNSSGFLKEEREWITNFLQSGFIDSFRHLNTSPHNYTWWSYRANSRQKNLGWRIDYNMVSETLKGKINDAKILSEVKHSDHCPVLLELRE